MSSLPIERFIINDDDDDWKDIADLAPHGYSSIFSTHHPIIIIYYSSANVVTLYGWIQCSSISSSKTYTVTDNIPQKYRPIKTLVFALVVGLPNGMSDVDAGILNVRDTGTLEVVTGGRVKTSTSMFSISCSYVVSNT